MLRSADAKSGSAPEPRLGRAELALEARELCKSFGPGGLLGRGRRRRVLSGVSLQLRRGEGVALVGESGSGKSTLGRLLVRLDRPDSGQILLGGQDALAGGARGLRAYRAKVQMVFQDPFGSLNPAHRVAHHLERPLLRHGRARRETARAGSLDLLRAVGLEPAEDFVSRFPSELSGGQRQRVAIARALAPGPEVLIADEPTSMLDVSLRAGVLDLLAGLKRERGLALLLITHDLASASELAERILVLYRGRVVEEGPAAALLSSPAHPYTRALLAAAAGAGPVPGAEPQSAADPGAEGCPFAPRCPEAVELCRHADPEPRASGADRTARCHHCPRTLEVLRT